MKVLLTIKKCVLLFVVLSLTHIIKAQNHPMVDGTTLQTCSGVFMDPGGTGNYSNGATISMTIEPLITGDGVCLDFTSFILDYSTFGYSELSFYDGSSTSDPLIMTATGDWVVNASGTAFDFTGPGMICANGPLTIQWNPDDSDIGWEADISCFTPLPSTSGCSITADGTSSSTTNNVLYINAGDQVDLAALGSVVDVPLNNNFNTGTIGTGWNSTVTADFTNPACVGGSSDGTTFLWMGTNSAPRTLSSQTYDVSSGGTISFDIKFATQAGGSPCEGPDLVDEGVYLQYSIDSGVTWSTLHYFFPSFYTDGSDHLQSWNNYVFNVPPVAQTTTTAFRWTQQDVSSSSTDHWGVDNVVISIANPSTISWDQGLGLGDNHTVNPAVDTVYTATVTDSFGNTCNTPVQVFINTPSTTIDFDGTNDYINRSSFIAGEDAISMMTWIKLDSSFDGGDIMGEGNYRLYIDSSNRLKSSIGTAAVGSTVTYTINMFDSYSDGWNTSGDGYVAIFVGGVQIGSDFDPANGVSPDTATFTVNVGDVVDIAFQSDNYPGEMSFNIDNTTDGGVRAFPASGNQSHSGGSGATDNFSFTASCSTCPSSTASLTTPDAYAPTLFTNLWYNVATIYDGSTGEVKNYLNGELQWSGTGVGATIETGIDDFEIGRKSDTQDNYFEGAIYESRVYDVVLTETQLREQIYQGVQNNGGKVQGTVIPKDIDGGSLNWSNLVSYYKMDTVVSSDTSDSSTSGVVGSLNNMTTNQERTAPVPYVANASGAWTTTGTWQYGSVWDITSLPNKDWAIVQVTNNSKVTTTASHIHLGTLVDSGSELSMENDQLLTVTSYLKLDGHLDLVGESQLIQTTGSTFEPASTGYLERDQQGKSNIYSYNFWSSPVYPTADGTNNSDYSLTEILKSGINASLPQNITFTASGYNGSTAGNIMTVADYWIFRYRNQPDAYSNWTQVRSGGDIKVGEGYTMKGTGAATQNYVFSGKPNNGTIQHTVGANNVYFVGNPYASALDANKFINDNLASVENAGDIIGTGSSTGALYFWEHFSTNNSHVFAAYEGGYATYNLLGGVIAVPDVDVSSNGSGSIRPGQYVPVGQGFFVQGSPAGGIIEFNNSQRFFRKEADAPVGNDYSVFAKTAVAEGFTTTSNSVNENSEQSVIQRVYFKFTTSDGPQRELLLGVKEGLADGMNYGYDARLLESLNSDCAWLEQTGVDEKLVIQGVGSIYDDLELPLQIKIGQEGVFKFEVGDLSDLDPSVEVYFLDKELNTRTRLELDIPVEFNLTSGVYNDRFYVVFKERAEAIDIVEEIEESLSDLVVFYNGNTKNIEISNPTEFTAKSIVLYNVLGQEIVRVNSVFTGVNKVEIPVNVASGTYLVRFDYNNGTVITKKLIIN